MGGGKSTILRELSGIGYNCIAEPAREILKEQRTAGYDGTPDKNPARFNELMLKKMIFDYKKNQENVDTVIFDRGIPDVIAYAGLLKTDRTTALNAANEYKYNASVFMFEAWKDIYTNDEERKMSFELSAEFAEDVRAVYQELGYVIINVPFVSVEERAGFIKRSITEYSKIENSD